ncbi:S6 family peptidase [Actinobacillus porcinus]|uniref:S6 family peptidase n=1 Tax=Actinobacillus porcinus TaxID=51048 RepID=UPI0023F1E28A|nr:S6 family peptidase [Actinobacillus porcinus]MDD7544187.1 S6 family peptidase [Actinobacillus porcinus]MDY5847675.1 S6 family peptidase [Actinobacillus porcinus]
MHNNCSFRYSLLALLVSGVIYNHAYASTVPNHINYQDYRDFAENKGKFTVGAKNVAIHSTSGAVLGTIMTKTPMPDFSAVSKNGIATLVNPQFITSVAHNTGYTTINFGYNDIQNQDYNYLVVARNNFAETHSTSYDDYHAPRLNKLVTEAEPLPIHYYGEDATAYRNPTHFLDYVRLGSGSQYQGTTPDDKTNLSGAYKYLTGGTLPAFADTVGKGVLYFERSFNNAQGAMPSMIEAGDSGSPLLAYDAKKKQWGFIGVARGISSSKMWYTLAKQDFTDQKVKETYAGTLNNTQTGASFIWAPTGNTSQISGVGKRLQVDLKDDDSVNTSKEFLALNHGKSVIFTGKSGVLTASQNIHQGAGALEFETDYTVKGATSNTTWVGAGIVVAENKTVNWQLKNPEGDRLSKLGKGTLNVSGAGVNQGDISVGDGTVILAMNTDANGQKQAFNKVEIVSGRSTVVLADDSQVKPENIVFGYHGGRLDLNGTTFNITAINNQDEGAQIVNHNNNQTANLIIRGNGNVDTNLTWGTWGKAGADIYEYINTHHNNRKDYFVLKNNGNPNHYYPTNQSSNASWEYIGSDKEAAVRQVQANKLAEALTWGQWATSGADIYEYVNTHAGNRKDYFVLKNNGRANQFFPTNQTSNESWEYIGSDKINAIETAFAQKMAKELTWGTLGSASADIYERKTANRTDYFTLKENGNANSAFPTTQTSNTHWQYIGSDLFTAVTKALYQKEIANLTWGNWGKSGADIYEYINNHARNRTDYFVLKEGGNANSFYPTNQTSNASWEFLGSNKDEAIKTVLSRQYANSHIETFAGMIGETSGTNGKMNVTFAPTDAEDTLVMTGGMKLNGELKVNNGAVILSGRPVPHAYDFINNQEVIYDNEWLNREFRANAFSVNHDGKLIFGRNAELATGSFYAAQNGLLQLGFVQGNTPVCQRSDYTGVTTCQTPTVGKEAYDSIPTLQAKGNVRMWHNAQLHIGKSILSGAITADKETQTTIEHDGQWLMSGNSSIGSLVLNGGVVDLNADNNHKAYQKLTINGNLSGQGQFIYLTNVTAGKGDHVTVNGTATGSFSLSMANTGTEPNSVLPISLFTVDNHSQNAKSLKLSLNEKGYVDLGTYRYIIKNQNNDYLLYSPLRDAQINNNYSQIQSLLSDAQQSAKDYAEEVIELSNKVKQVQTEQKSVKLSMDKAQQQVNEQQAKVNSLPWIRFIAKAQARKQLTNLQKQLGGYTNLYNQLQTTIEALDRSILHAQNQKANAEAKLEAVDLMVKDILVKAEKLCLQTESAGICNAVVNLTSGEPETADEEYDVMKTQKNGISRYANAALSELSAQIGALLQVERNLHRELVTPKYEPLSVWVNYDYQQIKSDSDNYRGYQKDSTLTQLGVEGELSKHFRLGSILSSVNSSLDYDQAQGKGKLNMATLYLKAQSENGWLSTLEASYGQTKNELQLDGERKNINRDVSALGINFAKAWQLESWKILPSFGIKRYRLSGENYTLNGANVQLKPLTFTSYQAGLSLSRDFMLDNMTITPRISTIYVDARHHSNIENAMIVNGNPLIHTLDRHLNHEFGITFKGNNWSVDANLGVISSKEIQRRRYAGLKVGYYW